MLCYVELSERACGAVVSKSMRVVIKVGELQWPKEDYRRLEVKRAAVCLSRREGDRMNETWTGVFLSV